MTKKISVKARFDLPGSIWNPTTHLYEIEVDLTEDKGNEWYRLHPIVACDIEYKLQLKVGKDLFSRMFDYEVMPLFQG